jgi:hypothetical protein
MGVMLQTFYWDCPKAEGCEHQRWVYLKSTAWSGHDHSNPPQEKWTNEAGWVDLWASPRGYAAYVPQ